jgi:hypothetical protein
MSSLDFEIDSQLNRLELEWRQAYEVSIIARADWSSLAASSTANAKWIGMARERLNCAEALKSRIMAKIESLEGSLLDEP